MPQNPILMIEAPVLGNGFRVVVMGLVFGRVYDRYRYLSPLLFNGCRQCRRPQNRKEDGGRETRSVALHRKKLNP